MSDKERLRRLMIELHYFQQMARVEARALKESRRKCKEIGAELRKIQKEMNKKPTHKKDFHHDS